jgi:hypothetical protein
MTRTWHQILDTADFNRIESIQRVSKSRGETAQFNQMTRLCKCQIGHARAGEKATVFNEFNRCEMPFAQYSMVIQMTRQSDQRNG